jgi:AcrR family transcriptional regulator
MRALAAELGVEAMSLYWHVRGKGGVLDGVVEVMLSELDLELGAQGWREGLEEFATRFRAVALAHPHAFPLFAARPVSAYAAARDMAEDGLRALVDAGLNPADAAAAQRTVVRYVIGFALSERAGAGELGNAQEVGAAAGVAGEVTPLVAGALEGMAGDRGSEALFRFGLGLILDGLAGRISAARRPPG